MEWGEVVLLGCRSGEPHRTWSFAWMASGAKRKQVLFSISDIPCVTAPPNIKEIEVGASDAEASAAED